MTGRSFALSIAVVTAIVCSVGGYCVRPPAKPLPAKTAARIVEHRVLTIVDSQRVKALELKNAALVQQGRTAAAVAAAANDSATVQRHRADSLETAARSSPDSAKVWHQAHDARKAEAGQLRLSNDSLHSVIRSDSGQLVTKDSIIGTERGGRLRADSLVAELLPLAHGVDDCRILRFFICPTRKQVFVGGTVLGAAAGYAIATKKEIDLKLFTIRF